MNTTTDDLISEIEAAAKAATPGPWIQSHRRSVHGGYRTEIYTDDDEVVATASWYPKPLTPTTTGTYRPDNAQFIAAANPANVLALIAELRSLRADAERYRWLRDRIKNKGDMVIAKCSEWSIESWSGDNPDDAIDTAMQAQKCNQ